MRLKHSKLSEKQTNRLCEHFVAGTPARTACELVGVNKNTAALFYHRLRAYPHALVNETRRSAVRSRSKNEGILDGRGLSSDQMFLHAHADRRRVDLFRGVMFQIAFYNISNANTSFFRI